MSSLDRQHVRVFRSHDAADDGGYMPGTPAERLSQVWELAREAWAFFEGADAEQRLQRDVAVLIRVGDACECGQSDESVGEVRRADARDQVADVEKLEAELKRR